MYLPKFILRFPSPQTLISIFQKVGFTSDIFCSVVLTLYSSMVTVPTASFDINCALPHTVYLLV